MFLFIFYVLAHCAQSRCALSRNFRNKSKYAKLDCGLLKAPNCRTRIVTKCPVNDARKNVRRRCWFDRASEYLFLFYDTAFKDSKIIKGTYVLSTAHLIVSEDLLLDWFVPWGTPATPPSSESNEWFIKRQAFSPVLWFCSSSTPSPSPVRKADRRHTGRLRKSDNLLTGEGGEGGGRGTESFYRKEVWASTNHSILSAPPPSQEMVRKKRYCM